MYFMMTSVHISHKSLPIWLTNFSYQSVAMRLVWLSAAILCQIEFSTQSEPIERVMFQLKSIHFLPFNILISTDSS